MIKKLWLLTLPMLLGLASCSSDNEDRTVNNQIQEKDIVGLWWNEFEYADVTETGLPFSRVLIAVKADADHKGCIYLGLFDSADGDPLAVYGGSEEAGFTWRLQADGSILLSDPTSGESVVMARRAGGKSYGDDMTNVSSTSLAYSDGHVTLNNGSYSGTLARADAGKAADIEKMMQDLITTLNGGDASIGLYGPDSSSARSRQQRLRQWSADILTR